MNVLLATGLLNFFGILLAAVLGIFVLYLAVRILSAAYYRSKLEYENKVRKFIGMKPKEEN